MQSDTETRVLVQAKACTAAEGLEGRENIIDSYFDFTGTIFDVDVKCLDDVVKNKFDTYGGSVRLSGLPYGCKKYFIATSAEISGGSRLETTAGAFNPCPFELRSGEYIIKLCLQTDRVI